MNILLDLFLTFVKIGGFTFGGGYAMIALLDYECVERKGWITKEELMDVTVIAESTPGPIAINCATYTGYKQAGIPGALLATIGIVFPSFLIIMIISSFLEDILTYSLVVKAFKGIRLAVALLIFQAGVKMTRSMMRKTQDKRISICFTASTFVLLLLLNILAIQLSTIYLIIIAALLGFLIFYLARREEG